MEKHLLITGVPGVGKTTLCKHVINVLEKRYQGKLKGFYTEEVRKHSSRIGFDIVSIDKTVRAPLARVLPEGIAKGPRVSKYTVDLNSIEQNALPLLKENEGDVRVIIIDEIGKMELFSQRFKSQVMHLFECNSICLVCTVPVYSITFVDLLKRRDDVKIIEVTKDNRNNLVNVASEFISSRLEVNL